MIPYLGQITLFPYTFSPERWMRCEGQTMRIMDAEPLFQLIGTNYGGDGESTFALPDLRAKEPMAGVGYYIYVYLEDSSQYPIPGN